MESLLMHISVAIFVIIVIKLALTSMSKWYRNSPPSLPTLPFIGHLYLFKKPLHLALARLSSRHGPILLLHFGSRPVLVISSAALAEECFTKNDLAFASRPQLPTLKHISYNFTSLAYSLHGPHWRNLRRIANVEVLSAQRLNSFSDVRAHEAREMIRGLLRDSRSSGNGFTRVEMRARLFGMSLNVIMTMVAGRRFFGDEGSGSEKALWFREMVEDTFAFSGASNLQDFLPVLRWFDSGGVTKKVMRLMEKKDEFLTELIEEDRRDSGTEGRKKTMITQLLSMQESDPGYYTDEIIKALIDTMLVDGTHTTASTVEWALSLLLNNPETLKKAQREIDTRVQEGQLLQESDLQNLPYLSNIISETLRLFPAGPLLAPHESIEDCTVGGFNISKGTMLLCNAYAIHRDAEAWPESAEFIPERFEATKVQGFSIPFGLGRRRCPGEALAMRVVGLELGTLIQCFEWERIGEELLDMTMGSGVSLSRALPLQALYKPRLVMMDVLSLL